MNVAFSLAVIAYVAGVVLIIAFSIKYLVRTDFLPYHAVAVGRSWGEVDPRMQVLLLALIRMVGSLLFAVALAELMLLNLAFFSSLRIRDLVTLQVLCLFAGIPPVAVTLYVRRRTGAATPVRICLLGLALPMAGFALAILSGRFV